MSTPPADRASKRRLCAWAGALAGLLTACGRPALTAAVINEHGLVTQPRGQERLRSLQIYISGNVSLVRTTTSVADGANKLVGVKRTEQIDIASGTPGAIIDYQLDASGRVATLIVGFDPAARNKTLRFGLKAVDESIEDNPYELLPSGAHVVQYGANVYSVTKQSMWQTHLLFDGAGEVHEKDSESPPGWRVGGNTVDPPAYHAARTPTASP